VDSSCASDIGPASVRVEGFSYTPPASARSTLCGIDLQLRRGECALLTGPTGSGKTTLLRAIAGILPPGGRVTGRVAAEGRLSLLFQNVETQCLFTTVEEEVASGLRWRGDDPQQTSARVTEMLGKVGLSGFERHGVDALSAGEKQRTVLAALLALEPAVLLLDEPTCTLDRWGRERLVGILSTLKERGHALLVADHFPAPFRELADHRWVLKEGRLQDAPAGPADAESPVPPRPLVEQPGPDLLRCESLGVRDAGGRRLLENVSLQLRGGERVLVTGPNGCGKTTLLRTIAGLVPPTEGRVSLALGASSGAGATRHAVPRTPHRALRQALSQTLYPRTGFLFQNPQRNLFERTVGDELSFALRRMGHPELAVRRRVEEVLDLCGLTPHRERSPLRLSFGEQHRVAVASVLAPEPDLLLVDEPFAGLDPESRARLLDVLEREQDRRGMAMLVASHDELPLSRWTHRCVRITRTGIRHA